MFGSSKDIMRRHLVLLEDLHKRVMDGLTATVALVLVRAACLGAIGGAALAASQRLPSCISKYLAVFLPLP
jgi:hypothetical protein